jgi:hypothetical protein
VLPEVLCNCGYVFHVDFAVVVEVGVMVILWVEGDCSEEAGHVENVRLVNLAVRPLVRAR